MSLAAAVPVLESGEVEDCWSWRLKSGEGVGCEKWIEGSTEALCLPWALGPATNKMNNIIPWSRLRCAHIVFVGGGGVTSRRVPTPSQPNGPVTAFKKSLTPSEDPHTTKSLFMRPDPACSPGQLVPMLQLRSPSLPVPAWPQSRPYSLSAMDGSGKLPPDVDSQSPESKWGLK